MSDKKTRARKGRTPRSGIGKFSVSSRNISKVNNKRAKKRQPTKGNRNGYRKFSKLGATTASLATFGNKKRSKKETPSASKSKSRNIKGKAKKVIGIIFVVFLGIGLLSAVGMALYLKNLENSLPDPNKLIERTSDQSTILYDRNGEELFKIYGQQNRQFVPIDQFPEHTKWALLAAEDVEFYQHKGLDWKGIVRCGIISLQSYYSGGESGGVCGASTITQQLVRNTLMFDVFGDEAFERSTFYKTVRRKLRELLLSMQVERTLSKDEILQLYMNEVPLGGVNYGYGAAAQSYYDKDVPDLDLAESAMLAGLIQRPSIVSPVFGTNPDLAPDRQKYVLDQMEKNDSLTGVTSEEIEAAKEQEMIYSSGNIDIEAYHFVFYIKQKLEEIYGADVVERGGLRVTTSLDLSTQKIAQEEITTGIATIGHPKGVYNGSMVVLDPKTGQILAMVGSVDSNITDDPRIDGNVNTTTSLRQMGSSFKPYVYLTAFERYGPWFLAPDIPMEFGTYKPDNWDDKYYGMMVAREALIKSRNIPANYTMQLVGIDPVLETVEKVGITTLTDRNNYGLSLALGAGEMKLLEHAQGFSVFATGGIKRDVNGLLKVTDSKGEVLYEYEQTEGERVFDEKDVYMLNWVLCDLGNFGDQPFSKNYFLGGKRSMCGKTGTTNGPKDLVSIQYHKNLVVAMWSGNNNGEEVPGAWSTTVPLPIVHSFMERVASKYPSELPTRPAGIVAGSVCNDTGRAASKDNRCEKVSTIFVQGRGPKADSRESFFLCKVNDKVPTNLEEAKQLFDENGEYTLLQEATLLNFELENSQQQSSYEKYFGEDNLVYSKLPDSDYCEVPLGPGDTPIISLESPNSGVTYKPGDKITYRASARAKGSIEFVRFYFGGKDISGKIKDTPFEFTYTVPNSANSGPTLLTATVKDSEGRTANDSITVTVDNPNDNRSISITWPSTGLTIDKNVNLEIKAEVYDFFPSKLIFSISGPEGYSWQSNGSNSGSEWKATWSENGLTKGEYTILVTSEGITDGVTVKVE